MAKFTPTPFCCRARSVLRLYSCRVESDFHSLHFPTSHITLPCHTPMSHSHITLPYHTPMSHYAFGLRLSSRARSRLMYSACFDLIWAWTSEIWASICTLYARCSSLMTAIALAAACRVRGVTQHNGNQLSNSACMQSRHTQHKRREEIMPAGMCSQHDWRRSMHAK